MDERQAYNNISEEEQSRLAAKDLLADAIESADILKSVDIACSGSLDAELDALLYNFQSFNESAVVIDPTTLVYGQNPQQTCMHSPALPHQEADLPFSQRRKVPMYSKPVSMSDPRMLLSTELRKLDANEKTKGTSASEAEEEEEEDDEYINAVIGVAAAAATTTTTTAIANDDDRDDASSDSGSSSSESSNDSSTEDDGSGDDEEVDKRKLANAEIANTDEDEDDDVYGRGDRDVEDERLPATLYNIDSRIKRMRRKSMRSNKIEIISVVEQRVLNRPNIDMRIAKPRVVPTVKIPAPKPMFRKPVACKLDKAGKPIFLELPNVRRYNNKGEASKYAALGERAYPNDLVIGISDIWRDLVSRPEFAKYAYIKQRAAASSYGTILRTLSEDLEACTYVHKVTNNISSDLSHYTLVYGAVPLDMINCTLDVISYILSEYHTSRSRAVTGNETEGEETAEDPNYAPIKDGEIELLIFNYWQLSTQDLVNWNDQAPRLNLKRLLTYVWSLLPESAIKSNITKLAAFGDKRNRISAECMWYIKTNFIAILTMVRNDKAYVNAWNYFMKQSRVHHYACFHTAIEMHLRVRNVALSLRRQAIELADAECPGNMLTLPESQRIMRRWVGRPTPSASRDLCLTLNNVIFWAIQEFTMYLVRNAHYPRSKVIDLGHVQGFFNYVHDRVPIHEISLVEAIGDPVSLRKIRAMMSLQLSSYSPMQMQPKIADDAFALFVQFVRMTINYAALPATHNGPTHVRAEGSDAEEDEEADIAMMHSIKCTLNDFLYKRTSDGRRFDTWASTNYDNPKSDKSYKPSEDSDASDDDDDEDSDYSSEEEEEEEDNEYEDRRSDSSETSDEEATSPITRECRAKRQRSVEARELTRHGNLDYAPIPSPPLARKVRVALKHERGGENGRRGGDGGDDDEGSDANPKTARRAKTRNVATSRRRRPRKTPGGARDAESKSTTVAKTSQPSSNSADYGVVAKRTPTNALPTLTRFRITEKRVCRTKCVLCDDMSTIRTVEFVPDELSVATCMMCVEHIERMGDAFDVATLRKRVSAKLRLPLMFKIVDGDTRVSLSDDAVPNKRVRLSYNRFERDAVARKTTTGTTSDESDRKTARITDNVAIDNNVAAGGSSGNVDGDDRTTTSGNGTIIGNNDDDSGDTTRD